MFVRPTVTLGALSLIAGLSIEEDGVINESIIHSILKLSLNMSARSAKRFIGLWVWRS